MSKVFLLAVFSSLCALANLPANPLVVFPKGDMECVAKVTSHVTKPPPGTILPKGGHAEALMSTVEVTRLGNLQRNLFTWSDGSTTEMWTWLDHNLTVLEKVSGLAKALYECAKPSLMRDVLCPTLLDFDEASVSWITPGHLVGKDSHSGKDALHYQATVNLPTPPGGLPTTLVYQAWIDPKTLLPLAYDDGNNLYDLTFSSAPPGPLVVPDRFKKDVAEFQAANAKPVHR